jgi:hypothetical protein
MNVTALVLPRIHALLVADAVVNQPLAVMKRASRPGRYPAIS